MKKSMDFLLIIWACLFLIFLGTIAYIHYEIIKEGNHVYKKAIQNVGSEEISFEMEKTAYPFVVEEKTREAVINYAGTYYYSIPEEIRGRFQKAGWQLVLTNQDIAKTYYHGPVEGRLAGLTDSQEKRIYVHNKRNDIRRALIHEFGHFLDYDTGMSSFASDFKAIYESEKNQLQEKWKIDDHNISNEQEYFAEAFSQLILYPDVLQKNCPETYAYISDIMKN